MRFLSLRSSILFRLSLRFKSTDSLTLDNISVKIKKPNCPQYVPLKYLPQDFKSLPKETLQHLKWMLQKDLLGQDIFLLGPPGDFRRRLVLQYLELTNKEVEYVILSRDTTESDLKQRREICNGSVIYVDSSAVKAALEGRILILDGIEKAERNVLPVLNNLLENREMHLEDGRLCIPFYRYDSLLKIHSKEELNAMKLARVSEDFRVIALGLPVPFYNGHSLDPPLRSRFQARHVEDLSYDSQLSLLTSPSTNPSDMLKIQKLLSFAYTLSQRDFSHFPNFPLNNLKSIVPSIISSSLSVYEAICRLYPYELFLSSEKIRLVDELLSKLNIQKEVISGKKENDDSFQSKSLKSNSSFVPTESQKKILSQLKKSFSFGDLCLLGPKGSGKSLLISQLADLFGLETETIFLFEDMTARDLLQSRSTHQNGDSFWKNSPLVEGALSGKIVILDGIHNVHVGGTLCVLNRLLHDREVSLIDGTRLVSSHRYDSIKTAHNYSEEDMAAFRIQRISPNFHIVALGEDSNYKWITSETLPLFLWHKIGSLSLQEEYQVLLGNDGSHLSLSKTMMRILKQTHALRQSSEESLRSIARNSLSTRQLLRIHRRLSNDSQNNENENENSISILSQVCLYAFLPPLVQKSFSELVGNPSSMILLDSSSRVKSQVKKKFSPKKTTRSNFSEAQLSKIPQTLFYDTKENTQILEDMFRDFSLGEHLLLIGNQGVGKNKIADHFLHQLHLPREYIQLHRDTTITSLTVLSSLEKGILTLEDSPLVKAVKEGNILVIDEADKAPTTVTVILRTLLETGEMNLSDGRRISRKKSNNANDIVYHPNFRMIVLANRPGFPFLGNDFYSSLGDLFSVHLISNPSIESELVLLRNYGPSVPQETLLRLVKTFSELRSLSDKGVLSYPYSSREVVNIVKHLQEFPKDSLSSVVRNVFDFDAYDRENRRRIIAVLQKNGIPFDVSVHSVILGLTIPFPPKTDRGSYQILSERHSLPIQNSFNCILEPVTLSPRALKPLQTFDSRGTHFSQNLQRWSLPYSQSQITADVTVNDDGLHTLAKFPTSLYSICPSQESQFVSVINLHSIFPSKSNQLTLSSLNSNLLSIHEETSGKLAILNLQSLTLQLFKIPLFQKCKELSRQIQRATSQSQFLFSNLKNRKEFISGMDQNPHLIFYIPRSNHLEILNVSSLTLRKLELPFFMESIEYLDSSSLLSKDQNNIFHIIHLNEKEGDSLTKLHFSNYESNYSLGLSFQNESFEKGSRIFCNEDSYGTVFSEFRCPTSNRIYSWLRNQKVKRHSEPFFLESNCQCISVLPTSECPSTQFQSTPNQLEVIDFPSKFIHYISMPFSEKLSVFPSSSSLFKLTAIASQSNNDKNLVTVDPLGNVICWELKQESLNKSLQNWKTTLIDSQGSLSESRRINITKNEVGDLSEPKHGKVDESNKPHVGGNTWAGGSGGRDTAGLGGIGGPYRLDGGHDVHQVNDILKAQVPEHILKAAREMNRSAFEARLKEISMTPRDAHLYETYVSGVKSQIDSLRSILKGLQGRGRERIWSKNQTSGEFDERKLIEGLAGEKTIYKRRSEAPQETGFSQEKTKKLVLLTDVSGSMYRFNGHDNRLNKMLEATVMVMEAFNGYETKFVYDIIGHSGEESKIPFVSGKAPENEKERLEVLRCMSAHSQFCMSGDNTLAGCKEALDELALRAKDHDDNFLIVFSDANFDRYAIQPESFAALLRQNDSVNSYAIFIGSLGNQAHRLTEKLPAGKAFVCLDTKNLPDILKTIFTSSILRS